MLQFRITLQLSQKGENTKFLNRTLGFVLTVGHIGSGFLAVWKEMQCKDTACLEAVR